MSSYSQQHSDIKASIVQLTDLTDAELWQIAQGMTGQEQRERTEELNWQQQRSGLNAREKTEQEALLKLYSETILIRAQAVVHLKQRNYDVSDPTQFHPID